MLFIFRTDASFEIGTGHVMRCLTLARALREAGADSRFVCRSFPGNLIAFIEAQGFRVHALPQSTNSSEETLQASDAGAVVSHSSWLGVDWAEDARQMVEKFSKTLQGKKADWLVVDHYALDARWERVAGDISRRILVIDDLADRAHQCDILLDQNIGRTSADYRDRVNADCTLLTGTEHALLRPDFAAAREASLLRRRSAPIEKMLISMGGIDKDNATGIILQGLMHCDLPPDLAISVVMGAHAPFLKQISQQAADMPWTTDVLTNVTDMASLMAASDVAIGAAGSTTWERCCLGLPSVVIGTADNQNYVLSQLLVKDIVVVGNLQELNQNPAGLCPLIDRLVQRQVEYSGNAAALGSGTGCANLVERIKCGY